MSPLWSLYAFLFLPNAAAEQRPVEISSLRGLYVIPLSSRRLLQWHGYTIIGLILEKTLSCTRINCSGLQYCILITRKQSI